MTDKYKDSLQIDQFVKEALSLNSQLMQQKEVLCHKISQINPYYEISDKLTSQVVDMMLEYDEIHKSISNSITWQESEDGRKVDLPKLEESHKEIVFVDWNSWLKQSERAMTVAATTINNIIEAINKNLHGTNLVAESIPRFLPNSKQLEQQWRQTAKEREEVIRQMSKMN